MVGETETTLRTNTQQVNKYVKKFPSVYLLLPSAKFLYEAQGTISMQQLKRCNVCLPEAMAQWHAAPFWSHKLPVIWRGDTWLGSLPGNHSSCKWLNRWFDSSESEPIPWSLCQGSLSWLRCSGLGWNTEDLWCSPTEGWTLFLTSDQDGRWHHSVALLLESWAFYMKPNLSFDGFLHQVTF